MSMAFAHTPHLANLMRETTLRPYSLLYHGMSIIKLNSTVSESENKWLMSSLIDLETTVASRYSTDIHRYAHTTVNGTSISQLLQLKPNTTVLICLQR